MEGANIMLHGTQRHASCAQYCSASVGLYKSNYFVFFNSFYHIMVNKLDA